MPTAMKITSIYRSSSSNERSSKSLYERYDDATSARDSGKGNRDSGKSFQEILKKEVQKN